VFLSNLRVLALVTVAEVKPWPHLVPFRSQKKNGVQFYLQSSFASFVRKEQSQEALGNMTRSLVMASILVLAAERHSTNQPPNSTLDVGGPLSMRVSLEPLIALRTQMGEEPKSHVQLVAVIWAMFSRARDLRRLQMNGTVSTVFRSSSRRKRLLLLPFDNYHAVMMQE
jgi:hypothetical protein